MITAGALITRAALERPCSIGTHTLIDQKDDGDRTHCFEHTVWVRGTQQSSYTPSICDFDAPIHTQLAAQSEPNIDLGVSKDA